MGSKASWVMVLGLAMAMGHHAVAKPPDLPDRPGEEWRVPVFPLGEKYREGKAPTTEKSPMQAIPSRPDLPIVELFQSLLRGWIIPGWRGTRRFSGIPERR